MKITKTTRFFFIYTLYFILALGVYVSFYLYINNKSEKIGENLSEIEVLKEQHKQMENLSQTIKATEVGRAKLSSFFVDSDMIIEFLESVEDIAGNTNVDIDVSSINEVETDVESVKELVLNINFEGEWSNVHHFLFLVENMPLKIVVSRLSFKEGAPIVEDGAAGWRGSVTLKVLQLKK
jgi:negative regulator of replication initiation